MKPDAEHELIHNSIFMIRKLPSPPSVSFKQARALEGPHAALGDIPEG